MTPLLLAAAGVLALVIGSAVLRTFGPRFRVGRLLATTPRVTIAEALELAASGNRRYVRVDGRIDQSTITTLERLAAALPPGAAIA